MSSLIRRFRRDDQGGSAVEYALLIVFVAIAIAAGADTLGKGLSNIFNQIGTQLTNATLPPLP